jgi:formamidopyrimidine-DNA glycosylase
VPELPDIEAYIEALRPRVVGQRLIGVRLANPFLLRTVDPPLEAVAGARVETIERLGKRLVFETVTRAGDGAASDGAAPTIPVPHPPASPVSIFLVLHLMIAGRLHWKELGVRIPKGSGLAAFDFATGSLILTEAGKKRRASLRLVRGRDGLAELDPGGLEVIGSTLKDFEAALLKESRTLKRALTDPQMLSGIGNAYSDEILLRARLSPLKQSKELDPREMAALHRAAAETLQEWTERLRVEARESFPEKVTAFRPGMAAHGRFGLACPQCGGKIQRIVYSDNECNYCPGCQTKGRILADRALSRLLKDDWPRKSGSGPARGPEKDAE